MPTGSASWPTRARVPRIRTSPSSVSPWKTKVCAFCHPHLFGDGRGSWWHVQIYAQWVALVPLREGKFTESNPNEGVPPPSWRGFFLSQEWRCRGWIRSACTAPTRPRSTSTTFESRQITSSGKKGWASSIRCSRCDPWLPWAFLFLPLLPETKKRWKMGSGFFVRCT